MTQVAEPDQSLWAPVQNSTSSVHVLLYLLGGLVALLYNWPPRFLEVQECTVLIHNTLHKMPSVDLF